MDNSRGRRYAAAAESRGVSLDEVAAGRIVERAGLEAALSREDLEAVLGRISEGIAIGTPDGRIVYANDAAARLLGVTSAEEVLDSPLGRHRQRFEIFDLAGRPLDPGELPGETCANRRGRGRALRPFPPCRGRRRAVALTRAVRILDERGALRYVVSVFRIVTEEKAAETLRKLERVTKTALAYFSLGDLVPALLDRIRRFSKGIPPRSSSSTRPVSV